MLCLRFSRTSHAVDGKTLVSGSAHATTVPPQRRGGMSRGEGEESGWLLGPRAPCTVSNSPTLKGSTNHGGDLANDVLIKRHISKRQLKRPEGEQAIRAHLYVDERESVDRPCIRIQGWWVSGVGCVCGGGVH